ncbi:type VI secretion system Vgr family protein [Litorisediminicola beolgyonensis]|uniref:Type VI secretion system Vgr family protein n=1 Tax=Litorisediminicola beolgyonensis TaxID=1173614 RepID=A0ABW3ZLN4_9RHOB
MSEGRLAELTTPLTTSKGDQTLFFIALEGFDQISRCFQYEVDASSEDPEIDPLDLLGQEVTVKVWSDQDNLDQTRYFHGVVDQFRFLGYDDDELYRYRLTLRPRLWQLSKTTDNRIFQEMSAREIVTEVLNQHGVTDHEWRGRSTLPPRDYCVQYGETDLDFVQRLLEHEGVFYYFAFEDGKHTLVLTDNFATLPTAEYCEDMRYSAGAKFVRSGPGMVGSFRRLDTITSGAHTLTDYDFTKPSADLMTRGNKPRAHGKKRRAHRDDKAKRYSYPGNYVDHGRGQDLANIRIDENISYGAQIEAHATSSMVASGYRFHLSGYYRDADNTLYAVERTDYVIWDGFYRARHFARLENDGPYDDGPGVEDAGCRVHFNLIPKTVPFRPARITPKPVMKGPQTAVVCGPAGEEIFTDEYSRVKVQFHWDRQGDRDEHTSCFVRVSSVWAGSGWGFIQIPRIGQEVIVDFLEGDPDQPIITGRVYNAEQMPPYGLPGNATQSGWKSNSSPGGGGWNELMFEDKTGEELVYFQAQKDHDELIKNNETRNIGNDWIEDVGHDATQSVGNNRTESVGNDKSTRVTRNRTVAIGNNDTESVGNNRSLTVGSDETINIGSNSTETIGENHKQHVGLTQTIVVGAARSDKVGLAESRAIGGAQTMTVGRERTVRVGGSQSRYVQSDDTFEVKGKQTTTIHKEQEVKVTKEQDFWVDGMQTFMVKDNMFHHTEKDGTFKADKNILVEAGDQLVLKCGKASIVLKKDGTITIDGKDITINGSGKIIVKASGEITMKGSKINQN